MIKPQKGAQTDFLKSSADICIFGGSAGSGKSMSLLLEPLRYLTTVEGFNAIYLRRTYPEITNPGGLWDESKKIYTLLNTSPVGLSWKFYLDSSKEKFNTLTFSHMQHEKDKYKYQGSQIALICFDELTHFSFEMFSYMLSRNRSVCGVKPYIRATTNPDPDSWVKSFIQWWINPETGYPIKERSGVKRYFIKQNNSFIWGSSKQELIEQFPDWNKDHIKSVTFIPATIYDNKILLKEDPSYLANLKALDEYEQSLLLHGNWNARKVTGEIFKEIKYTEWDSTKSTWATLDPAYSGKNNTSLSIGYKTSNFVCKGHTWRKSVEELYEEILVILAENNCSKFFIEKNADKGLSAKEFQRIKTEHLDKFPEYLRNAISCIEIIPYSEHDNKHIRIIHYAKKNWDRIYFSNTCQKEYTTNILNYKENQEPDDEIDSLAGLCKFFLSPLVNNKPRQNKIIL